MKKHYLFAGIASIIGVVFLALFITYILIATTRAAQTPDRCPVYINKQLYLLECK